MNHNTTSLQQFRYLFLFFFFFPFLLFVICNSQSAEVKSIETCISMERDALVMFKQGLVDNSGLLSSWDNDEDKTDCCQWIGVRCSNQTGHVIALDLSSPFLYFSSYRHDLSGYDRYEYFLEGKFSSSLLELRHLSYLNLSYNHFGDTEPIPKFIGSLIHLEYLDLSYCYFHGIIPSELGNLSKLRYFDIGDQTYYPPGFVGAIEMLSGGDNLMNWLSSMTSLIYLDMSSVDLHNATLWFSTIMSLPSLSYVDLSDCFLSTSPTSFSHSFINFSTSISTLHLEKNFLTGSIPNMLGNLTLLTHLNLSNNLFEGVIPGSFGNLCNLQTLDLNHNIFHGNFSEFLENFYGCVDGSLQSLDLSWNNLTGPIPDMLGNKTLLTYLSLMENQLEGVVPKSFRNLRNLRTLDLSNNILSGNLPEFIANLSFLSFLDLSANKFDGMVPDFTGCSFLRSLMLNNNQLSGTLSEVHLFNLTMLKLLDLSFNNLTIELSGRVPLFQLDVLSLRSCNLGPKFPRWFKTQTHFLYLDISDNEIADTIPMWFWSQSTTRLQYFNASLNTIIGVLPDLSSRFGQFPMIDLSFNVLEGQIPCFPSNISFLSLSGNMFSGLTLFSSISYPLLSFLDLSLNLLFGEIPDHFFKNMTRLYILNLSHNKLSGDIPSSMVSLSKIQTIELQNNSLSGELPLALKNCTALEFLNLGGNKLSGNIPSWVGESLSNLYVLIMRSNQFSGSIPIHLCLLTKLQLLDLSANHLSGHIPQCFNNFTAMIQKGNIFNDMSTHYYPIFDDDINWGRTFRDRAFIQWKGSEREFTTSLGQLKSIDLSKNELTGEFPKGLTDLAEMVSLNLSRNKLHGVIPQGIGQLVSLDSLDLSRNMFSGEIPPSMSALHFLGYLDLAYNNFSGRIPEGLHFHGSQFMGNDELCGPPLTSKCRGDHVETQPPLSVVASSTESDEDELYKWFYIGSAIGFATSFWAVACALLFYRPWRHAYFRLLGEIKDWLYVRVAVLSVKCGIHKVSQ